MNRIRSTLFFRIIGGMICLIIPACAINPPISGTTAKTASGEQVQKPDNEETRRTVAARVNAVDITMDKVIAMMNRISAQERGNAPKSSTEELKKTAINRLIFQELAYQDALKQGIKADALNIENAIANFKANSGGEQGYSTFLTSQGLTETDVRSQVERSLTLELMVAREVYDKTVVPVESLTREYERLKPDFVVPGKVMVTDIVFFLKTDDKDSLKKAQDVLDRVRKDKDNNPWNLVLDGSFIVRNLELKKTKDRQLYDAATSLKKDGLSDVIRTDDSMHIIRLMEHTPERQLTFEEVKTTLESKFRAEAQQKRFTEWEKELKKSARIVIIDAGQSLPDHT